MRRPVYLKLLLLAVAVLVMAGCGGRDRGRKYHDQSDLANARIGVLMGSTHDTYITNNFPNSDIVRIDTEPDLFVALDAGKADAMVIDLGVYKINHEKGGRYVIIDTVFSEDFGVGFNLNNTELRDRFNLFLSQIRSDGTYKEIEDRWFGHDHKNARMPAWDDAPSGVPIRVGMTGTTAGFAFVHEGRAAGLEAEILSRFARWEGRPIEFAYINFGGLIATLSSNKVDIIVSGMTITPERSKQVAFSDSHYRSHSILIVLADNYSPVPVEGDKAGGKKKLTGLEDIKTHTVGVILGNLHDVWMNQNYPDASILRFDNYPDVMMSLDAGNTDIGMIDGVVYSTALKKTGKYETLAVLFDDPYGVGFRLDNTALRDQFNVFLNKIHDNGVYDEMVVRWIDNYDTAKMPEWPDKLSGKPLRLGCTGASDAFDIIQNGRNAGFDIELIERFGREIGRPVEFYTFKFGSLIAALSSGKVDMIASAMSISPERAKQVAFSDPYFISQSLAVVLKERYGGASATPAEKKSKSGWASMDDVKDKRFGVLMSSTQDEYVTKIYPEADILRIDMSPDLVLALKTGQCDVIVLMSPEVKEILKKNDDIAVLDPDIFPVEFGIGFRDGALRDRFNIFLSETRKSGLYDEVVSRWMDSVQTASMPRLQVPDGAKPLVIGTTAQSMPFTFFKDGAPAGLDIELVARFAALEGRAVKFEVMSFGGLIPALISGKIDIMAAAAMMTAERRRQVKFSDAYYKAGSTVLALKKNLATEKLSTPAPLHDGSDLASSSVGAMTGTTGEMYIGHNYPKARLSLFDDITDAIAAMRAGKTDYVITAYTTATLAARHNKDLFVLPREYISDPAAIAIRKDNTELLDRINGVLGGFRREGVLEDIAKRWLNEDGGGYKGVEAPAGAPVLKVAVAANREPMCFVRDGRIVGLDCELIERIAAKLGMRVEYQDMKFSALITALESGRADVVISNYTRTEERAKRINFTADYFVNPQVLLTMVQQEETPAIAGTSWFSRVKESFYNNLVLEKRWRMIVEGLKATLVITFFAVILGTILGGVVCALRMSRRKTLNGFARLYITVMRGTPILVMLMIFFYVIFASSGMNATVVAIITFALNMAAYSSEMFRTSIEGVDHGQKEAGIAMGFTKLQTFIYIIMPQAVKKVVPVYKGEVISLLKMTSIVGYIAVVDLTKASDIIRSRTFDAFFPLIVVAIIYFLLAWLLGLALDYINRKITQAS